MVDVDLNLLRVFDTLYELRSVTRAGARLGLTQSAVSHALRRLREAVNDPLFVRATGGLQPTPRATEIAAGVREGLVQLRSALAPSQFDPATTARRFTVAAGPYFCALLIPALAAAMRQAAPGIDLKIVPLGPELLSELDDGEVDIALGAFSRVPPRLATRMLFREQLVWIAAADNAIASTPFDPESLPADKRLTLAPGRPFETLKALVSEGELERRIVSQGGRDDDPTAASVYDAQTAIAIVARTDLVALVPRRFAEKHDGAPGIAILDSRADTASGVDLAMLWHSKFDADAGLAWMRERIAAMTAG